MQEVFGIKILIKSEVLELLKQKKDNEVINQYVVCSEGASGKHFAVKVSAITRGVRPSGFADILTHLTPELDTLQLEVEAPAPRHIRIPHIANKPLTPAELANLASTLQISEKTFCCC